MIGIVPAMILIVPEIVPEMILIVPEIILIVPEMIGIVPELIGDYHLSSARCCIVESRDTLYLHEVSVRLEIVGF